METDLRKTVHNYIDSADERLLNVVKAVIESYKENDVVAWTMDGKALTKKEYDLQLNNAVAEVENGNYISQEELEEKSKNW